MSHAGLLLKEFRKSRKVSLRELARRTGIDAGQLTRIEHGEDNLTFRAINLIRRALLLNQQEADQLVRLADPRGRYSEMERREHRAEPVRTRTEIVIESRAQQVLYEYSLSCGLILRPPIPYGTIADQLGLSVREVNTLPGGVNAEIYFADREIRLDAGQPATRKAFSCCHEIGHWVLHKTRLQHACRVNDLENIPAEDIELHQAVLFEIQANLFASALLMPSYMVLSMAKQIDLANHDNVSELARSFGVSIDAMQFRLMRLRLVDSDGVAR